MDFPSLSEIKFESTLKNILVKIFIAWVCTVEPSSSRRIQLDVDTRGYRLSVPLRPAFQGWEM